MYMLLAAVAIELWCVTCSSSSFICY